LAPPPPPTSTGIGVFSRTKHPALVCSRLHDPQWSPVVSTYGKADVDDAGGPPGFTFMLVATQMLRTKLMTDIKENKLKGFTMKKIRTAHIVDGVSTTKPGKDIKVTHRAHGIKLLQVLQSQFYVKGTSKQTIALVGTKNDFFSDHLSAEKTKDCDGLIQQILGFVKSPSPQRGPSAKRKRRSGSGKNAKNTKKKSKGKKKEPNQPSIANAWKKSRPNKKANKKGNSTNDNVVDLTLDL
jgi:hypothetical protein